MLDASGLRQLMQHAVIINSNQIQLCRRDTVFPCVSSWRNSLDVLTLNDNSRMYLQLHIGEAFKDNSSSGSVLGPEKKKWKRNVCIVFTSFNKLIQVSLIEGSALFCRNTLIKFTRLYTFPHLISITTVWSADQLHREASLEQFGLRALLKGKIIFPTLRPPMPPNTLTLAFSIPQRSKVK